MDAVRPDVDVALVLERALTPLLLLLHPGLLEPNDRRWREASGLGSDQVSQALREVAGGDALEVQPGDELVDRLRPPKVRRQDLARESESVAVFIHPAIVHAWLADLDDSHPGLDSPLLLVSVAGDETAAVFIDFVDVVVDVGGDFVLDRPLKHLLGAFSQNLLEDVVRG